MIRHFARPRTAILAAAAILAAGPVAAQMEIVPDDVIYGRQILMSEMEAQMAPIDRAAIGEEFDLESSRVRASGVSAMLGVTPYLFPPGTDMESTADGDMPSIALPAVWDNFEAFKAMADQSAQLAFDLSQTTDEAEFRTGAATLRAACNACHGAFMQAYESPF